jgi:hypothetical protein
MQKDNNSNAKTRRKGKKQEPAGRELGFFRSGIDGRTDLPIRRRCTLVNVITAVTGNVYAYAVGTANATAAYEFANLAALYQEYRVRAVRARVVPRVRDNIQTAVGVIFPGTVVSGAFTAPGTGGGTLAAVFAQTGAKVHPEWTAAENMVTWEVNPDAKLWTVSSATVASANQFGVQFTGVIGAPAVWNTLTIADTLTEFDIEFRTRL